MKKLSNKQVSDLYMWLGNNFDVMQATALINTLDTVLDVAMSQTAPLSVTTGQINDASPIGKQMLTASDAASVRAMLGAGTSNITLGTTSTTALRGDYKPQSSDISDATPTGQSLLQATSGAAVRAAIGAGTSNLSIGTTASTAMAGNAKPASASTADTLSTPRSISLQGGASGTVNFDGSQNAVINTTLAAPTSSTRGGITQAPAIPNPGLLSLTAILDILGALRVAGVIAT